MRLNDNALAAIDRYLDSIEPGSLKRGQRYFEQSRVTNLACVAPESQFSATVFGSEAYNVLLTFSGGHWLGQCSCPMSSDCKHLVAAFLDLQDRSLKNSVNVSKPQRTAKQPPNSPLYEKLVEQLGRKLFRAEADFVQKVQNCHASAEFRPLMESDLASMSARPGHGAWERVELGPKIPKDDYIFWLYVAWNLRKRNWPIPDFAERITDFKPIEPEMRQWEREHEIAAWKKWFQDFREQRGVGLEAGDALELRLVLFPEGARLQWRQGASMPFSDFKQTDAKKFGEQFDNGALTLSHESLPLWSATYKPWHYESWWSFNFAHGTSHSGLNRLLRMPLAPDRVVDLNGNPLVRHAERLRFELRAPEDADGDYQLSLVKPDGSAAPRSYCTLRGEPTLYLTAEGLFEGPCAEALRSGLQKNIPAAALETSEGMQFLSARNVPLPPRIQSRIRTVTVKVTIKCTLAAIYPGSRSEDICISISAKAPKFDPEEFTPRGWEPNFSKSGAEMRANEESEKIILHDRAMQNEIPRIIGTLGAKWSGYPGSWRIRVSKKTPETFAAWLKSLPVEIEVLLDKQLATLRDEPVSGAVSLDVAEAEIDWFDLKVALKVTDTTLTPEELKLLLNAGGGYVRLGKKGWRRLQFNLTPEEDEQLARMGLNPRDLSAEPQRFHALQLADDAAKRFLAPERVEKIRRRASELKARVTPALPGELRVEMRPYQIDGFNFLAYLASNRFGGVLADDMGLGKTIQTLAWLAWLRSENPQPLASLVVCPKSVMDNWRAEVERFYPDLRVRLWKGEFAGELDAARAKADLIVVNYSQLRSLLPAIAGAKWLAVILDEAQYIKNPDSQTAQAARSLKAEHRLALTGTPIENRLLDLWSILAFAMPGALGNRSLFARRFNAKEDPLARRRLAARVRPFLLRRTKAQVAKDLPDRVEEDLLCEMEGQQQTLYRAELKRARQLLLGLKTNKQLNDQRFNILTSLLRLRQICCHPALVDSKLRAAESAKVAALEDVLEPLMEEGHKALVFSQFVTMLDLLRERATERQWKNFYLAGETENRGELVKEFQNASGGAVFFISLKAGGFGLNLAAASYVVLFDPWWNPAVENQAIDRTHRIGQTNKVIAYRLLMRESIEEKIRALQKQKASLAEDVLGEERFAQSLTLDDLKFLFAD